MNAPPTKTISVAILDEQATIAAGIAALISSDPRFTVTATFATVADLDAALKNALVPDVLLMDIQQDGASCTSEIRQWSYQQPDMGILVFSLLDSRTHVHDAIACGALGFLSKSAQQNQLVTALAAVPGLRARLPRIVPTPQSPLRGWLLPRIRTAVVRHVASSAWCLPT